MMRKKNPLAVFMALSNDVTNLNSLDNSNDQFDIISYDELLKTFNVLHNDMASLS